MPLVKRTITLGLIGLAALFAPHKYSDATSAKEVEINPWVVIGQDLREPILSLKTSTKLALLYRNWYGADRELASLSTKELTAEQRHTLDFLRAWVLVHAGKPAAAAPLLEGAVQAPVPLDYRNFLEGTVLLATKKTPAALAAFEKISEDSILRSDAMLVRAKSMLAEKQLEEGRKLLSEVVDDPASGGVAADAALALARSYGAKTEEGKKYYKHVYIKHPLTAASKGVKADLKSGLNAKGYLSWQEVGIRAENLAKKGYWSTVIQETERVVGSAPKSGLDACRLRYSRGRALYRRNRLSDSIQALAGLDVSCADLDVDYGARALYLTGYAMFRKSNFRGSAKAYGSIGEKYPNSSYADDGYTRAGIALLEAQDLKGAQAVWTTAMEKVPDGDTVPEAMWRLAWTSYLNGETDRAIEVAERLAQLELGESHRFVSGGRYWAARWRLYPDVEAPTKAVSDPEVVADVIQRWEDLCKELPASYYGILAYSRLRELAPERADGLLKQPRPHLSESEQTPWFVRLEFLENKRVRNGIALARAGLVPEAKREWGMTDLRNVGGPEMAWLTELRWKGGDWLLAHDAMRQWMKAHPAGSLGEFESHVIRVAFPNQYWKEVKTASAERDFEPRMFHALVREESNFNTSIVSYAGARGLSQLMPGTAVETAKWMGTRVELKDLHDPKTNLKIGAKFLDVVYNQTGDSPFLALAAYNAGPTRVNQWVERFGNVPIDEYVESIPIRQTRIYVKRVMESWQTYRWHRDEGQSFPDLSRFNHYAKPAKK